MTDAQDETPEPMSGEGDIGEGKPEPGRDRMKPDVCAVLRGEYPAAGWDGCVIVLGAARGGTSMCSGLLRLIGVDMGGDVNAANNEDKRILDAREPIQAILSESHERHAETVARLREAVGARAQAGGLWGWKDPLSYRYFDRVADLLPDVRFVVMFRDLLAVASREFVATGSDYLTNVRRARGDYDGILDLIDRTDAPVLAASYEKTLRRPGQFITSLGRFVGRRVKRDDLPRLAAYVRPEAVGGNIARFEAAPGEGEGG